MMKQLLALLLCLALAEAQAVTIIVRGPALIPSFCLLLEGTTDKLLKQDATGCIATQ